MVLILQLLRRLLHNFNGHVKDNSDCKESENKYDDREEPDVFQSSHIDYGQYQNYNED